MNQTRGATTHTSIETCVTSSFRMQRDGATGYFTALDLSQAVTANLSWVYTPNEVSLIMMSNLMDMSKLSALVAAVVAAAMANQGPSHSSEPPDSLTPVTAVSSDQQPMLKSATSPTNLVKAISSPGYTSSADDQQADSLDDNNVDDQQAETLSSNGVGEQQAAVLDDNSAGDQTEEFRGSRGHGGSGHGRRGNSRRGGSSNGDQQGGPDNYRPGSSGEVAPPPDGRGQDPRGGRGRHSGYPSGRGQEQGQPGYPPGGGPGQPGNGGRGHRPSRYQPGVNPSGDAASPLAPARPGRPAAPRRPAPPVAPGGGSSGTNWGAVAQCESGGNWSTNTGNGYFGGLQFLPSTWHDNGGAGNPAGASQAEQIRVAENVKKTQGMGAWPVCGRGH